MLLPIILHVYYTKSLIIIGVNQHKPVLEVCVDALIIYEINCLNNKLLLRVDLLVAN